VRIFARLVATVGLLVAARPAAAQVPDTTRPPPPPAPDTSFAPPSPADSARILGIDSLPKAARDSLRRAVPDSSKLQRYLAAQLLTKIKVLSPDPVAPSGPEPVLSRIVLTRDSLDWAGAATLSDLLARVPGVYVWRGGWTGQPGPINYEGRGATSAEYVLDGLPYIPAGVDSVGIDPSLLPLSILDRVEIERWPGLLRVRLFTRNHDRLAPRSRVGFARGTADFARYQATLERRSRSGLGFFLGGENLSVPTLQNIRAKYANTQLFVQGSWLPNPRWGLLYQVLRSRPNRDPTLGGAFGDTLTRGIVGGNRTDVQLRGMWRRDTSGLGPRADLLLGRMTAGDSLTGQQRVHQAGLVASYRWAAASLGSSVFWRSRWTSLDARGTGGWTPLGPLTLSGEAAYQRHDGGRSSRWVAGRAGLAIPGGIRLSASARAGSVVAAPALTTDSARSVRDWGASAAWEQRWISVEAGLSHTAAWQPFAYQPYKAVPVLGPVPATDWVTLSGRLHPLSWLTLEGCYGNPRGGAVEGLPPKHIVGSGTFRTKFQRVFPSGVLDLKLQLAVEHWDAGVIGRDAAGTPITLDRATYLRSLVQLGFGALQIYWDRANIRLEQNPYVPGLPIVGRPGEVGVRWEFSN
jgi:hypothetical protein